MRRALLIIPLVTIAVSLAADAAGEEPAKEYRAAVFPGTGRSWPVAVADGRSLAVVEDEKEGNHPVLLDADGETQALAARLRLRKLAADGCAIVGSYDQILKREDGIYWRTWQAIRFDEDGTTFLMKEYQRDHYAIDINSRGTVVGYAVDEKRRCLPVLWNAAGPHWIRPGIAKTPFVGRPVAIDERGHVAINPTRDPKVKRETRNPVAYVYDPAKKKATPIREPGWEVRANDLFDGRVVGVLEARPEDVGETTAGEAKSALLHRPFVLEPGSREIVRLPRDELEGAALATNATHVVGFLGDGEARRAVRWARRDDTWTVETLAGRVEGLPEGWTLRRAIDVSPDGGILCEASTAGKDEGPRAVVLWRP